MFTYMLHYLTHDETHITLHYLHLQKSTSYSACICWNPHHAPLLAETHHALLLAYAEPYIIFYYLDTYAEPLIRLRYLYILCWTPYHPPPFVWTCWAPHHIPLSEHLLNPSSCSIVSLASAALLLLLFFKTQMVIFIAEKVRSCPLWCKWQT